MTPIRSISTIFTDLLANRASNGVHPVRGRILIEDKIRRKALLAGALTG